MLQPMRPKDQLVTVQVAEQIQYRIKTSARRFVFDTEASQRFAEVVRDVPDLLVREEQFARAPFDVTWLEIDFIKVTEVLRGAAVAAETPDSEIGFLVDHGTVYTVVGGAGDLGPKLNVVPFIYDLHTEWSVEDQLDFCSKVGTSRGQLDATFWGSTFNKIDEDTRRSLRGRHAMRIAPMHPHLEERLKKEKILSDMYYQTVGDLRNVITALLLLNRPSLTVYKHEVPHHRTFVRGKLRPYLAHTVISIPLDPRPTLRLVGTPMGDAVPRRRHEVRGHYCHDEKGRGRGCVHLWEVDLHPDDDPLDPDHWRCKRCEGKRWWRSSHERGSALLGFNKHDYNVTT